MFAGGLQGEAVGDFEGCWEKSCPEDGLDGLCGLSEGFKAGGKGSSGGWEREEAESGFGDYPEEAFGADKKPEQIEPGLVFVGAASGAEDFAAGEAGLEAEDVLAGDPIFEAARAAGVGGDVAPEAAIFEACGIWGIEEAFFCGGGLEVACEDARFDNGDAVGEVDFLDTVHSGDGENDAALYRDAATDVTESRAPRGDWDAVFGGEGEGFTDVLCGLRKDDGLWGMAGEPFILGVRGEGRGVGVDDVRAEDTFESLSECHGEGAPGGLWRV
jgi:hypothetical protein